MIHNPLDCFRLDNDTARRQIESSSPLSSKKEFYESCRAQGRTMRARQIYHAFAVTVAAWLFVAGASVAAQNTLSRAKELYLSAAYDEALAILDGLSGESGADD